jgi:hypothetical protein
MFGSLFLGASLHDSGGVSARSFAIVAPRLFLAILGLSLVPGIPLGLAFGASLRDAGAGYQWKIFTWLSCGLVLALSITFVFVINLLLDLSMDEVSLGEVLQLAGIAVLAVLGGGLAANLKGRVKT